ncbi:ferric reduction oxidase 8, mitochondrial [Rutidosis leptorrhynchoides]|uniref:ferric reduction oxidase 8, mitochondrial n=1 Tax=Rutidosis leptorrhynchoides TaxID=125765 RepID=UPI003A99A86A
MAKHFLLVLKFLMVLLAIVWASIWVMKPTQIWTRKWKEAEDAAKTTVFGSNGLDFAVLTFPIIAFVMMGYVYLHFKPKERRQRHNRNWITALSNPIIVNSFIGVLSAMEVIAIITFIIFLTWTFYIRISNDFKKMMPIKTLKLNMWQYKTYKIATRCGSLAEACLALLLFPIMRGMTVFRLFGIQFEASVRYHIWIGTTMLTLAIVHGAGTLFIWGIKNQIIDEMWKWQKTGRIYLAGEISLIAGLIMWMTSLPQVRRKRFELFYYTHHLYTIFIVFFLFHTGDRHFYMVFPAIFLFAIEKLLRIIQSRPQTCIISARIFPFKAIEVILPKEPRLKYTPTSIIFIKIPSISKFQWHSFSIASSSNIDVDTMSVIIKCDGSWTNSLYNMIQAMPVNGHDQRVQRCIPVSVEGPYGPASTDFLSKYDSLLLVAGGIGVTPFLSILQEISSTKNKTFPTKIQLVYITKKRNSIGILNSIVPFLTNEDPNMMYLKLKTFVTQETQSGTSVGDLIHEFSQVETVNFDKERISYALNGNGSSLLMAVIVLCSSVLFFAFLIIFSHVFLPQPKKASLKEKTASSLVDLVLIFAFILSISSSVLVLLVSRLKRLGKEYSGMALNHKENVTHASPFQSNRNLDEHEIHFGARPDFHDIFSKFANEMGGSYVGVLVCGPEDMKESVASVCKLNSQGSTNGDQRKKPYFNFHSLNFTL